MQTLSEMIRTRGWLWADQKGMALLGADLPRCWFDHWEIVSTIYAWRNKFYAFYC